MTAETLAQRIPYRFFTLMVQLFLANIREKKWLFTLLSVLKWMAFIEAGLQLLIFYFQPGNLIENIFFQLSIKTGVLSFITIIGSCIYSYSRGFKPALFLLIGQSLFIIGAVGRALFLAEETYMFPPSLFEIGLVAEVIIISYGLMYRYNQYKRERELLKHKLEVQEIEGAKQMLTVQESEQKRIARDLHDELGGNLAAIKMTIQSFQLPGDKSHSLLQLIDNASSSVRNIAHNLMPPEFESTSLKELLEKYYHRLNTEGKIKFLFYDNGGSGRFDQQQELMIYRIAMEITNNIIRHSGATDATVQLIYYETYLEVMAEDNGSGIKGQTEEGIGLKNLMSRVDYLHGKMDIDSGAKGTTIIIHLPYKSE